MSAEVNDIRDSAGGILVVDDEPVVRSVCEALFRDSGWRVYLAENGQEGVAAFLHHQDKVDIVLMDVCMPDMDGVEAAARIRGIAPDMPIVLTSGQTSCDVTQLLQDKLISAFIRKPFRTKALRALVDKLRDQEPAPPLACGLPSPLLSIKPCPMYHRR